MRHEQCIRFHFAWLLSRRGGRAPISLRPFDAGDFMRSLILGALLAGGLVLSASSNAFAQRHPGWPTEPLDSSSVQVYQAPAIQTTPVPHTTYYRGPMTAPTGWYWSNDEKQWYWFDGMTLRPASQVASAKSTIAR